jgi:di/tricarboxylate transporter
LSGAAIFVIVIVMAAVLLFITEIISPDIVALLVLCALGIGGVIDTQSLLSGFSSPAVVSLIGLFMITSALRYTGVTAYLSRELMRLTKYRNPNSLTGIFAFAASVFSLLMNTVASVALIAPVARAVAFRRNVSPSKLLMPVAYGALLGGMATLLTTSNLLLSSLLSDRGLPPLHLFDFLPVGGPIALVGLAYLAWFAPKILPERSPMDQWAAIQQTRTQLTSTYVLGKRLFEGHIETDSPLIGRTLAESHLGRDYGITVAAVIRGRESFVPPDPTACMSPGDVLLLAGRPDDVSRAAQHMCLATANLAEAQAQMLFANDSELAEVALSPHTSLAGQTLGDMHFRENYGLNVLALWHEGKAVRSRLSEVALRRGDALLVQGTPERLARLSEGPDFLVLTHLPETPHRPGRAITAVGILLGFLILVAFNLVPVAIAALLGGIAAVLMGCETIEEARGSIQWQVLFLIAGMLPLARAFDQTGLTALIAGELPRFLSVIGPRGLLLLTFGITLALTQLASGPAATLIIGPVAIAVAQQNGFNPAAFAIAVAIGASTAFLTPVAHAANLMVMGLGGYRFRDYARLGLPLIFISAIGVIVLIPLFYPF